MKQCRFDIEKKSFDSLGLGLAENIKVNDSWNEIFSSQKVGIKYSVHRKLE